MEDQTGNPFFPDKLDFFIRVLELVAFDGNIIDFHESIVEESVNSKFGSIDSIITDPSDYSHNMKLLEYKLFCENSYVFNRTLDYEEYLESVAIDKGYLFADDYQRYRPLDFMFCNEKDNTTLAPDCVWGVNSICFVCNPESNLINFRCKKCNSENSTILQNNDKYFDECTSQNVSPLTLVNVYELGLLSLIDKNIYFMDTSNELIGDIFYDILFHLGNTFVNSILTEKYSMSILSKKTQVITFKLDFKGIPETAIDFPLHIRVLHVVVFLNAKNQREITVRNILVNNNSYPIVTFSMPKDHVINPKTL